MIKKLYKRLDRLNRMRVNAIMDSNYQYMFVLSGQMVDIITDALQDAYDQQDYPAVWDIDALIDFFCIRQDVEDFLTLEEVDF